MKLAHSGEQRRTAGLPRWRRRVYWASVVGLCLGLFFISVYFIDRRERASCEQGLEQLAERAPTWPSACEQPTRDAALVVSRLLRDFPELPPFEVAVDWELRDEGGARVNSQTGAVHIHPRSPLLLDASVWVHELAHVQSRGARPSETVAVRILAAFEEGLADYYAASLLGRAELGYVGGGPGPALRDLHEPPQLSEGQWPRLGVGATRPHDFGWALASILWEKHGANPALASTLLQCLAKLGGEVQTQGIGARVFNWVFEACPRSAQPALNEALQSWLPAPLYTSLDLRGLRPLERAPIKPLSNIPKE